MKVLLEPLLLFDEALKYGDGARFMIMLGQ
jgi:hypothetical protein